MDEIFNNIKIAQANKLKKDLFGIVLLSMPLLIAFGDAKNMLFVVLLLTIPLILIMIITIYHIYIYNHPEKAKVFKRLKDYGSKERICDYLNNQLEHKIVDDGVIILTPELLIDKNNYENIFLNKDIFTSRVHGVLVNRKRIYLIRIDYADEKKYEIDYSSTSNSLDEIKEIGELILKVSAGVRVLKKKNPNGVITDASEILKEYNKKTWIKTR